MRYTELVFELPGEAVEAVTDALLETGALSVTVEDFDANAPDEQPLYGEPGHSPDLVAWPRSTLVALYLSDPVAAEGFARGAERHPALLSVEPTRRYVDDQDWVRLTQAQFEPFEIPGRLWVGPSWHTPPNDTPTLWLDPGQAFGTGSHATTRLCLRWLSTQTLQGLRVLDYGCGTGILALGAHRFGAAEVLGVDIDPAAVDAARENAQRNAMPDVRFVLTDAKEISQGPGWDVVVANILARPLMTLAPLIGSLIKPGGALILAGLLQRQIDEVAEAYRPYLKLAPWHTDEEWALLAGRRD